MKETLELRVDARHASRLFADDEGTALGEWVRKVVLSTSDSRLPQIAALDRELRAQVPRHTLFGGWYYRRRYSRAEIAAAPLLTLSIGHSAHLSGDVAGTIYDSVSACPVCGAGRRRLSPLRLHLGKLPRLKDIVRSGSDECIVSASFVEACERFGARGVAFSPVEFRRTPRGGVPAWYEMSSTAPPLSMSPDTICASGPFPDAKRDSSSVCPLGDTIGHARITEVRLAASRAPDADVIWTREYLGSVMGLFTPHRELLISNRLYRALAAAGIRGLGIEIARLRESRTLGDRIVEGG
ncbi:MAG: hypothetical protein ABIP93_09410 [Gemmatimonadaceae bacterium]